MCKWFGVVFVGRNGRCWKRCIIIGSWQSSKGSLSNRMFYPIFSWNMVSTTEIDISVRFLVPTNVIREALTDVNVAQVCMIHIILFISTTPNQNV